MVNFLNFLLSGVPFWPIFSSQGYNFGLDLRSQGYVCEIPGGTPPSKFSKYPPIFLALTHWYVKGPLLDAATEVYGLPKNHQWKPETWWWNEEVDKAIQEKHARFKVYSALKKGGMTAEAKGAKTAYTDAKRKHAIWLAKSEVEKEELSTVSPDDDVVFCFIKQMDHRNQEFVGEKWVRNDAGELALTDEDKMEAWVEH